MTTESLHVQEECILKDKLVLIVDDDPDSRRLIQGVVEGMVGTRSAPACDGEEALRQFRDLKPDLVLLDLTLPRLDGFEVARRLRSDPLAFATPLIAVSGLSGAQDRALAREVGCDEYILKPFRLDHLADRVRERLKLDVPEPMAS